MEKQYIISEKEYDWIKNELQKAIVSDNLIRKQTCLRLLAVHFGMDIIGGMSKVKEELNFENEREKYFLKRWEKAQKHFSEVVKNKIKEYEKIE